MCPAESPPVERSKVAAGGDLADRDARHAALVAAAAAGDARAFERFYDATFAYARTVARRLLRGDDVEDLLADAYFEAWRHASRFDPARGSAVTWLLAIVHSRSLDRLRRQRQHPEGAEPASGPASGAASELDCADEQADPVDRLWRRQAGLRLHAALAALDANERWALGLAYFRDCSQSEIARLTGLPLGTVKSTLLRAQAKLRQSLQAG